MGTEGKVDGCALFFRTSRFSRDAYFALEFNDAADAMATHEDAKLSALAAQGLLDAAAYRGARSALRDAAKRLMRDNVAQVALLRLTHARDGTPLATPRRLCVVNTHLFWDPAYADVKLWQTHALVTEIERLVAGAAAEVAAAATASGGRAAGISGAALSTDAAASTTAGASAAAAAAAGPLAVVICGDFNSEPGSAVHRLMVGNWEAHCVAVLNAGSAGNGAAAAGTAAEFAAAGARGQPPPLFPLGQQSLPGDAAGRGDVPTVDLTASLAACAPPPPFTGTSPQASAPGSSGGVIDAGAGERRVDLRASDLPPDPFRLLATRRRLGHSLLLASAHAAVTGREPMYTNYTREYRGTLDYIFVSADTVRPIAALGVPHPRRLAPAVPGACAETSRRRGGGAERADAAASILVELTRPAGPRAAHHGSVPVTSAAAAEWAEWNAEWEPPGLRSVAAAAGGASELQQQSLPAANGAGDGVDGSPASALPAVARLRPAAAPFFSAAAAAAGGRQPVSYEQPLAAMDDDEWVPPTAAAAPGGGRSTIWGAVCAVPAVMDDDGAPIALPSASFPSDHLPAVVDVILGQAAGVHAGALGYGFRHSGDGTGAQPVSYPLH